MYLDLALLQIGGKDRLTGCNFSVKLYTYA